MAKKSRYYQRLNGDLYGYQDEIKALRNKVRMLEENLARNKASIKNKQEKLAAWEERLEARAALSPDEETRLRIGGLKEQRKALRAENKLLRALVADMWHELNYEAPRADDGYNGCLERIVQFEKRMFELGLIECEKEVN